MEKPAPKLISTNPLFKIKWLLANYCIVVLLLGHMVADAQSATPICANSLLNQSLRKTNPAFDAQLQELKSGLGEKINEKLAASSNSQAKTTALPYKVNVVFHVVLTASQISQLDGVSGIKDRINTQMQQLNEDWNARNADSAKIPAPFKPLYGNMNVEFVLATKDPMGNPTPGYEIVLAPRQNYNIENGLKGSTYLYSDAKYSSVGGADAWDPNRYYNVWILNMLPVGFLGASTPPPYPPYDVIPQTEQGTCIFYGAFGVKTNNKQFFPYFQATMGRSLTHETGHFFNLFHVWGETDDCSDDDGIGDTPLQGKPTPNNAPTFPFLDACSNTSPGIMFMNFMDYAIDSSQCLFTLGQVAAAHIELDPGGSRQGLVPSANNVPVLTSATNISIYPNPATTIAKIEFSNAGAGYIVLTDVFGRIIEDANVENRSSFILNMRQYTSGIYFVKIFDSEKNLMGTSRIVKQ